jgi:uncharacterized repeat protein (TIGR02543 family)
MATFNLYDSSIKATVSASAKISSSNDTRATITVTATGSIPDGWEVWSTGVVATMTINGESSTKTIFGNAASEWGDYWKGSEGPWNVTYSITVDKSTAEKDISWSVKFYTAIDGHTQDLKHTATGTVSVPAKTSYTVSYNANGGTGAPSSQTKWHGTTLTLTDDKPTRTGYSFQGWALSDAEADAGDWYYQAGGSCGKNEDLILYAVWKANTYSVTYNANGGTGAPSSQTKTYGVTLKLSATVPTRGNYNFKGWATSATATTATYAAGANYTANAKVTLYAVWELAYVRPRITNLTVTRVSYDGTTEQWVDSDNGTSVRIKFEWETDQEVDGVTIEWESNNGYDYIEYFGSPTGTSGAIDGIIEPPYVFTTESNYTFKITVTDAKGHSTEIVTVPGMKFAIDFKAGGNGAAIGKPAELEGVFDVALQTRFLGGIMYTVLEPPTDLDDLRTPGFYVGENTSTYAYTNCPITAGTFTLEILSGGPSGQVLQRLTRCDKTKPLVYERWYYTNAWGAWHGGWVTATLSSSFAPYSDTLSNTPKYRKDGRLVEIRGIVTPTADIEYSTDNVTIFTLPNGYIPDTSIYVICQGSGNCVWTLRVHTNGTVCLTRYRNGDTGATASAGAWLPFHITYFAE